MTRPTADQLLASRAWRVRHSLWLLAPVLGVGYLGLVGFVYLAVRDRTRRAVVAAAVGTAMSAITWVAASAGTGPDGKLTDLAVAVCLLVWVGQVAYGAVLNRHHLRERARQAGTPWYAAPAPARQPVGVRRPAPGPVADPTSGLRDRLESLVTQVHTGPALPADVRVVLDRIFGRLREVLDRAPDLAADPERLHVVDRIVTDYVPTSLNAYVALPAGYATTAHGRSGRTPHEELLRQLGMLDERVAGVADALYAGDAARLEAQGRFLEDRFRRSELDLS